MFNKIAPRNMHQGMGGLSSSSVGATGHVEINSDSLTIANTTAISPAASVPVKEKLVYTKNHWTAPFTKSEQFAIKKHHSDNESANEKTLTKNLAKLLHVGSIDALNIMEGIFKYHRYDTTLLRRYMNNRTQHNLKALEIQIENRLFVVYPEKWQKPA